MDEEIATLAGGCFWCMEYPFEKLKGVNRVVSGYAGGQTNNPTYEEVTSGRSGHLEAVQVHYHPSQITYSELLDVFWRQIDPTDSGGQFVDRGTQYATAIFYHNEEQKRFAEESKQRLDQSKKYPRPVVTAILPATSFYPAEDYHQDFHKKNPLHYQSYRSHSGRDDFLKKIWKEDKK